jgi:hypothetical protein
MAIIHALLALSSFAVVLTAGTVQAHGLPPEGPVSGTFTDTLITPSSQCRSVAAKSLSW